MQRNRTHTSLLRRSLSACFRLKNWWSAVFTLAALCMSAGIATATEPCGELDECKALIEINATDGDVGFHFLADADNLLQLFVRAPDGTQVYKALAKGHLWDQTFTETFVESAEPLCWFDPEGDPDDIVITLEEFLGRWPQGRYLFVGADIDAERVRGRTTLDYELPAAPADVEYDDATGIISWAPGDDLGECASRARLNRLVNDGVLPKHPKDVVVMTWEVVFEPEDGSGHEFGVRVPGDQMQVTVPLDYRNALPDDTPVKIEVGAITATDNATFTEEGGICINEVEGCEEDD